MNSYIIECLERFQELPNSLLAAFENDQFISVIKNIEDKYQVQLNFLLVLIAIEELAVTDIAEYLELKFKISSKQAQTAQAEIVSSLIDPIYDSLIPNESLEKIIDNSPFINLDNPVSGDAKEIILKLFTEGLISAFSLPTSEISSLNLMIFKAFNDYNGLEDKVIYSLYNNEERLTRSNIIIDGKNVEPTIANWLKDFIKINGSSLFNELVLAEYISNSINARSLPLDDKTKLRRLLRLYRNLVFFPESLENVPLEKWAIIPVGEQTFSGSEMLNKKRLISKPDEKISAQLNSAIIKVKAVSIKERPVIKKSTLSVPVPDLVVPVAASPAPLTQNTDVMALAELEVSRRQYPAQSLEYKAITQEINKLKAKNSKKQ